MKGKWINRFKQNPLEKRFAEKWDERNQLSGHTTLDYLLAENNNRPSGEATDRDREVAATVIQWLGSPVGQCFLSDVLEFDIRDLIRRTN